MTHALSAAAVLLGLLCTSSAIAAETVYEGRLEYGDEQFGNNRDNSWYDIYPVTVDAGDKIRFLIESDGFLTGGIIRGAARKELYSSLGDPGTNSFEYEWTAPQSGTFDFIVFQSFLKEGNYKLTITEPD